MTAKRLPFGAVVALAGCLAGCTLLAPSREELGGGIGAPATDAGDAATVEGCLDDEGDPGPGTELTFEGAPVLLSEPSGPVFVEASYIFVALGTDLVRIDKATTTRMGRATLGAQVRAVHAVGDSLYVATANGVFGLGVSAFDRGKSELVLSGDTQALAAVGARVFAHQQAASRIVEVGGQGLTFVDVAGATTLTGNPDALFWGIPGNVRRSFQLSREKELFRTGDLPSGSSPVVALAGTTLVAASPTTPGCAKLVLGDARENDVPMAPRVEVPSVRFGGLTATSAKSFVYSSGSKLVAFSVATSTRRVVASRTEGCLGMASDGTNIYLACRGRKLYRVPLD